MINDRPELAGLESIAGRFATASPELLEDVRLLRRVDVKFMLPASALVWVLAKVARDYLMLRSDSVWLARYETEYLDTADLRCYHDHLRGRRPRHKIRVRHYPDRALSYFEIKTKRSNQETDKQRFPLAPSENVHTSDRAHRLVSLHTPLQLDDLTPSLTVWFRRMTLLSIRERERVTIDVGLDVSGAEPGYDLGGLVVIEVKQPTLSRQTPIMCALRAHNFHPKRSSKYCTSVALTRPEIQRHHVRSSLRAVEGIMT